MNIFKAVFSHYDEADIIEAAAVVHGIKPPVVLPDISVSDERSIDGEYAFAFRKANSPEPAEEPKPEYAEPEVKPQQPENDKVAEESKADEKSQPETDTTNGESKADKDFANKKAEPAGNDPAEEQRSDNEKNSVEPENGKVAEAEPKPEAKLKAKTKKNAPIKQKDETAGNEPVKPDTQPENDKVAEEPKADEKSQPETDTTNGESKPVSEVDVAAQQAAHTMNNGFDYTHFQRANQQQTMPVQLIPAQIQPMSQTQPPMPAAAPIYPTNYREMTPEQRCDHLVGVINRGLLPQMHNPRPNLSVEQKVDELKKHITFMDMPGRQIGEVRINSLLNMINSASLKNAMNKYDSVDRANNPKLTEVPVNKYATGNQTTRFDMAFEVKLKDHKKVLVVLYSTVPGYDPVQNAWSGDLTIFTKENSN